MRAFRLEVAIGRYKAGEGVLLDPDASPVIGEPVIAVRGGRQIPEIYRGISEGVVGSIVGICRLGRLYGPGMKFSAA